MNATMTPPQAEQITLYFREGSSDKVYKQQLNPKASCSSSPSPSAVEARL